MAIEKVKFAYADPPYPNTAFRYPEKEEVDHRALIARLETYDGWLLHSNPQSIRFLLPMIPEGARILSWGKYDGLPVTKAGLVYTWEPIFLMPLRRASLWVRDSLWGDKADHVNEQRNVMRGQKPLMVIRWLFQAAGLEPSDELDDLFPGTGAVGRAWRTFQQQPPLPLEVTA